ncbi:MAG: PHP domain-containing protein [Trueperaceae bacterium]|nr:MAG: PHP domain-containing protein [Trueperaceae bacterium]
MTKTLLFEGTVDRSLKVETPYVYLSFTVPEGTTRVDVRYRYDEGNEIDIGLFDPECEAFPSRRGFRGWSGTVRSSFFVAEDEATPGYLPGKIPAGEWRVMLGLYRLAVTPCNYRVEIGFDASPRKLVAPIAPTSPVRPGAGWYRGDLHSHTHHSDAPGTVADLAEAARSRGLDFLAVTDHNTDSHHRQLAEASSSELLLLPGQEVTTYRGHANVWGVDGWVDFRVLEPSQLDALVDQVHERGGLFSINHPKAIGYDWEYPVPAGTDCFEAWQAPWSYKNWQSLARFDTLLRQGRRLSLVGGSDRHQPPQPDPDPELLQVGTPTTWLWLESLSVPDVLAGLRSGRAFVSEGPSGPRLEVFVNDAVMGAVLADHRGESVQARATVQGAQGDRLRWVGAAGVLREVVIPSEAYEDRWEWRPAGPFIRAEVVAQLEPAWIKAVAEQLERLGKLPKDLDLDEVVAQPVIRALSNPVYLGV